jgi:hypothetical protein
MSGYQKLFCLSTSTAGVAVKFDNGLSAAVEKLWDMHNRLFVKERTADRLDFKINWCVTFLKLLRKTT